MSKKIIEAEQTKDQTNADNFNQWIEEFDGGLVMGAKCGAGIYNEGHRYIDGFHYSTVMINTCESLNMRFTLYMDEVEWYRIQHLYTTYDPASGSVENDSIITECHPHEDAPEIMGCTFEVGYFEDHDAYSLS